MSRWTRLCDVLQRWIFWADDRERRAYEHVLGAMRDLDRPASLDHRAATTGCVGTGKDERCVRIYDLEDCEHLVNMLHRGYPAPSCRCTADDALRAEVSDG